MISIKDEEREARREIAEEVFFEDNFEIAVDQDSCYGNYILAMDIFFEKYAAAEDLVETVGNGEVVDVVQAGMIMREMLMAYKYALRFRQQLTGERIVNPATVSLYDEPNNLAMKGNMLIGRYNATSHDFCDYETGKWLLYNASRI